MGSVRAESKPARSSARLTAASLVEQSSASPVRAVPSVQVCVSVASEASSDSSLSLPHIFAVPWL